MKRLFLFLALVGLPALPAWAQRSGDPAERIDRRLEQMADKLDLTESQTEAVRTILLDEAEAAKAWRDANPEASRADRKAHRSEMRESVRGQIGEVLTVDQQAIFETMKARGPRGRAGARGRSNAKLTRALRTLDLTNAQRSEVRALLAERRDAYQAWRADNPSASTEDRKAFRQSQREILDAGLASILTAEQLDALQTVKAERPKRAPRLRQLINRLDLSDAQKADFAAFFEAQRAQRAAWQEANPEATRADRRAYRQSQRGEMREAVETILTPAQQEQLKNARQRAKQRTKRRGGSPRAEGQRNAPATTFALSNAPNPFNPTTTLRFELRTSERVVLEVYNTQGQRVATLIDGERAAGVHTARFDAADLPTGTYIARLTVGRLVESRRLSLVK